MLRKILNYFLKHKFVPAIIILALTGIGYWGYGKINGNSGETRYVLAAVEKGTLITSVSGSGQVSASNQADIKPKVSGDVLSVLVKTGQKVKAGQVLAYLDASDVYKSIRDNQVKLDSAKLSLEKINQPAGELSVVQAKNSLAQAEQSHQKAKDDLDKAYADGFNAVSNAFLDLPSIMTGLEDIFFGNAIDKNQQNIDWYTNQSLFAENAERTQVLLYRDKVSDSYAWARNSYDKNFNNYRSISRNSDTETIKSLILETYDTVRLISDTIKNANNFIDSAQDAMSQRNLVIPSAVSTQQSTIASYTGTTNGFLSNLLSAKRTIQTEQDAITNAASAVEEKTQSLANIKAGADILDVQSQELAIRQCENSLKDAQEKLADYTVRSLFDGIVAAVNVKKGDSASSGNAIATIITKQQIAEIPLNEIDAAKVKTSQKAILTFDAIDALEISGEVAEIDSIGTVSQGIVTYNVKIIFDTQDERVKPGMSVSSSIMTEVKQDVLMIPNSAVKLAGNAYYVETLDSAADLNQLAANVMDSSGGVISPTLPKQQLVETGLINDTMTEITGGLAEGDQVIIRTITSSAATQSQSSQSQSLFQIPGTTGTNRSSSGTGTFNRAIQN
jgi:HlyD family secretion protein